MTTSVLTAIQHVCIVLDMNITEVPSLMKVNDSVAVVIDPEFRDNHYHARQYGRVVYIQERQSVGGMQQYVTVSWSDMGLPIGWWSPKGDETYHVGNLRPVCES